MHGHYIFLLKFVMTFVINNMGLEVTLNDSQRDLFNTINSETKVFLKDNNEDGKFMIENGLCLWVMHSGQLIPHKNNMGKTF